MTADSLSPRSIFNHKNDERSKNVKIYKSNDYAFLLFGFRHDFVHVGGICKGS